MSEHAHALNRYMAGDDRHVRFAGTIHRAAGRAADRVLAWQERARMRHALSSLDARMRDDVGIGVGDALHEGAKPFWRD